MTRNYLRLSAITISTSTVLSGCAGTLSEHGFQDRLSRYGLPLPAEIHTPHTTTPSISSPQTSSGSGSVLLNEHNLLLADLLDYAMHTNPKLSSARWAAGAATGQVWQAGLYPNPRVELSSGEIGFEGDSANTMLSITQPVLIGGRLEAAKASAISREAVMLAEIQSVQREIFGQIAVRHARVLDRSNQLELIDELIEIAQETLSIAETRFEAHAASEPDVIRPRVAVYQLHADRHRISNELSTAQTQLGILLNRGPISSQQLSGDIPLDPPSLNQRALLAAIDADHPAIIVADREIAAAQSEIDSLRAQRIPMLNITAGIGYSEEGDQGIVELGIGAQIPLWDQRQGDIMSARFSLMEQRQTRVNLRNQLASQLAQELGDYNAAKDQLQVMRDQIVPDSQRAFDQIHEAYRAGRVSFIDVLDSQRTLIQSRRLLAEFAGQTSIAKAKIATITGSTPIASTGDQSTVSNSPIHSLNPAAPEGAEANQ